MVSFVNKIINPISSKCFSFLSSFDKENRPASFTRLWLVNKCVCT